MDKMAVSKPGRKRKSENSPIESIRLPCDNSETIAQWHAQVTTVLHRLETEKSQIKAAFKERSAAYEAQASKAEKRKIACQKSRRKRRLEELELQISVHNNMLLQLETGKRQLIKNPKETKGNKNFPSPPLTRFTNGSKRAKMAQESGPPQAQGTAQGDSTTPNAAPGGPASPPTPDLESPIDPDTQFHGNDPTPVVTPQATPNGGGQSALHPVAHGDPMSTTCLNPMNLFGDGIAGGRDQFFGAGPDNEASSLASFLTMTNHGFGD